MAEAVDRSLRRRPGRAAAVVLVGTVVAALLVATFGVTSGGPHGGLGLPDAGSLVTVGLPITRVVTEVAAVLTVGLLLLATFLLPGAPRTVMRWAAVCGALWAVGALAMVPLSLADLFGEQLPEVITVRHLTDFAPKLPFIAAWYVSAAIAATTAVVAGWARSWGGGVAAFGLAVVAVLPVAATGHSAVGATQDVATDSLVVHVASAALWIGGVVALLALPALRVPADDLARAAARFSALALGCWLVTAGTGIANLAIRVDPSAWFTSGYGLLAMAKVAALLLLGALGFAHRRRSLGPLWKGDTRSLVRLAAVEVVVMLSTLGLAVALGRTAPPAVAEKTSRIADDIGYDLAGPPTAARLVLEWRPDLLWGGLAVLAAVGYGLTCRRLRSGGWYWPTGRVVAWLGGCAVILLASSSGVGRYAPAVFSVLMLQQVLLALVAPLLLVLGAPVTMLVRLRGDPSSGPGILRYLALTTVRSRWWRWITDPAVAIPLYLVTSVVVVVSGAFAGVLALHWGRHLLEVQFFLGGLVLFAALLGCRAGPGRLSAGGRWALVLLIVVAHQAAGLLLAGSDQVLAASWYDIGLSLPWGSGPLADQRYVGSAAWWSGQLPLLALLAALMLRLWRESRRLADL